MKINYVSFSIYEELTSRKSQWSPPKPNYTSGALAKFATLVGSAAEGAITRANP